MKKSLLMLAAALTAWSASAQLYVTGDNVEGASAWDAENPLEVAAVEGVYTFKATNNFKISTAKGGWDAFDGGAYQLDGAWAKGTNTATGNLRQGTGNVNAPMTDQLITYTVKDDLSSITATLPEGVTFGEAPAPDFYLVGDFNNWTCGDAEWKMTANGNVYTITTPAAISGGWKINNGSWSIDFGQGEEGMPVAGTVYSLAQGGAGNLTTPVAAGTVVTFTYNEGGVSTLLISDGGVTPPPTYPEHLYIVGYLADANWDPTTAPELDNKGDGKFSIEGVELAGQANFSFLTARGSWDEVNATVRYGAAENGTVLTFDDNNNATLSLVSNGGSGDVGAIIAGPASYNMTVTFKADGITLDVERVGEVVVVEDLVLTGSFNSWNMNDAAYKFTKDGATYTLAIDAVEAGTEFKVKTAEENWTNSWGADGAGAEEGTTAIDVTVNTAVNAWFGSSLNFRVAEALNNVTITFVKSADNATASQLTVAGTSAVEAVEAAVADAPAVYYNLQGMRVVAPVAGELYIVNRAGKISKEIAR